MLQPLENSEINDSEKVGPSSVESFKESAQPPERQVTPGVTTMADVIPLRSASTTPSNLRPLIAVPKAEATDIEIDPRLDPQPTPPKALPEVSTPQPSGKQPVIHTMKPTSVQKTPPAKTVTTTFPIEGLWIIPVVRHGKDRAYSDLPILFSNELAEALEAKMPQTKIYHPVHTRDELSMRGMSVNYKRIVESYIQMGRPDGAILRNVLDELATDGSPPIQRVAFVDAYLDLSEPGTPETWGQKIKAWSTDGLPKNQQYTIISRIQYFDTSAGSTPTRLFDKTASQIVNADAMLSPSISVYQSGSATQEFSRVSRSLAQLSARSLPKGVYQTVHTQQTVAAQTLPKGEEGNLNPPQSPINADDQAALRNILNRSNSGTESNELPNLRH